MAYFLNQKVDEMKISAPPQFSSVDSLINSVRELEDGATASELAKIVEELGTTSLPSDCRPLIKEARRRAQVKHAELFNRDNPGELVIRSETRFREE